MLARHLPRPLLALGGAQEVGVQATRRGADQPGPALDEPGPPGVLEGGEPGAGLVDVHVDHVHAAGRAGRDADVGVRVSPPPEVDDVELGAGVLEAVGGQRALAAGDARKDRDAAGSQVFRRRREIRCVDDVVEEPRTPPDCRGSLLVQLVHALDCPHAKHQNSPVLEAVSGDGRRTGGGLQTTFAQVTGHIRIARPKVERTLAEGLREARIRRTGDACCRPISPCRRHRPSSPGGRSGADSRRSG